MKNKRGIKEQVKEIGEARLGILAMQTFQRVASDSEVNWFKESLFMSAMVRLYKQEKQIEEIQLENLHLAVENERMRMKLKKLKRKNKKV